MKTKTAYRVDKLKVYPEPKTVVNEETGSKSVKVGALIFVNDLPCGPDVQVKNVITLTAKQLDSLASDHGIYETGKGGWMKLQRVIGVGGKAGAFVTSEPHGKGEKYVDQDGKEQSYKHDSVKNTVDSIILSDKVETMLLESVIASIVNYKADTTLDDLLGDESPSVIPVVEGIK